MAAAITPKTNPLLDSGEEFIIIMLCIVAKPDNPNPPININGKINQKFVEIPNNRIELKKIIEP